MITDYYVLRRGNISIRGIYSSAPDGPYGYWFGFNPAAIIAMAVGVSTYLYLLNPITYVTRDPFPLFGASVPAALAAAIAYALVTVLVVKPLGKGGYK